MCKWSNHCLHHLLPSERDTAHDLMHSYQLVCYNFCSTRHCFVIRMLIHCKHLSSDAIKLTHLLTSLLTI